jgi:hypothetical protein
MLIYSASIDRGKRKKEKTGEDDLDSDTRPVHSQLPARVREGASCGNSLRERRVKALLSTGKY